MTVSTRRRIAQALFSMALILMLPAHSADAATVKGLRLGIHGDTTRVVLDLDSAPPYRAFVMKSPYRLAIDLPAFDWRVGRIARPKGSGVSNVRQGTLTPGVSRIVVDLKGPISIKTAFTIPGKDGSSRLVVDFNKVSETAFAAMKPQVFGGLKEDSSASANMAFTAPLPQPVKLPQAAAKTSAKAPAPKLYDGEDNAAARPAASGEKPLIVIDPGHGGVDPGSLGVGGLFEKNVTIGMARELKKQLEATGRYRVLMTRDRDVYLKLGERVAFARDHHANLFISLHADSISRSNVTGASIYTLSDKASDAETAKLAARENRADEIAGVDIGNQDQDVATILVDLVMRDNMNQSKFFANSVISRMRRDGINLLEHTQRSAGFAVLKAPDIPSVLIELGFMTNAKESALLMSESYRRKVGDALVSGIDAYFHAVGKANRS
jgi:N-acetylmuramoyl-L-alanine amidase